MTKCFFRFISLLLFWWPAVGHAQGTLISGCIVDAQTKQPIPFVSVGIREDGAGALSNESGCFQFRGLRRMSQDSLVFMVRGYDSHARLIRRGTTKNLTIQLTKHVPSPAEIATAAEQRRRMERAVLAVPGAQYAFWLPGDPPGPVKLRAVAFLLGPTGIPKEQFRVRIYRADGPQGAPGTDVLTENVLYTPTQAVAEDAWYRLDLRAYALVPPAGGCFVAVEFGHSDRFSFPEHVKNYAPTGPLLTASADVQHQRVWLYRADTGWEELTATKAAMTKFNAMVMVELE